MGRRAQREAQMWVQRSITSAKTGSAPLVVHKQEPVLITAVIFLVLAVDCGQAKTTSQLKNATVLIIRHAEKPESGKHLSPAGVRRAQAYVDFFNSFTLNSHLVKVDHLFAAKKSKNSDRPSETLLPLSKRASFEDPLNLRSQ